MQNDSRMPDELSQAEIHERMQARIVVSTILNPPCLLLNIVDPCVSVEQGVITQVPGTLQTTIPQDQIDDFIALLRKKQSQLNMLKAQI